MMPGIFRGLGVALSLLAFVSGMTVQAIPSAEAVGLSATEGITKADPECSRMAMERHGDRVPTHLPCRGIMPDCVKQMGCLGMAALPDRSDVISVPVAYGTVVYGAASPVLSGRDVEPDLLPPIAG